VDRLEISDEDSIGEGQSEQLSRVSGIGWITVSGMAKQKKATHTESGAIGRYLLDLVP
jgi:hypothetical protein